MTNLPPPVKPITMASNMPMTPQQMETYLQNLYQLPVTLRKKGDTTITCPYCREQHNHEEVGYVNAQCTVQTPGIVIGERAFYANYGYTILEYEIKDGSHWLSPLPYLPYVPLQTCE
jgi:hypothetical protein